MRLLLLTMSAFGPYPDKAAIPFDHFGRKGVFLITGDTGAGKTTIFDAVTFALFGKPSGSQRESFMLRSDYAEPGTATFVELKFEHNLDTYIVKRNPRYRGAKLKGSGLKEFAPDAGLVLPDGNIITGDRPVTQYIQELLGVNYQQFSQIALIAQGDYMKILIAGSRERGDIFRKIFKTETYARFQQELKSRYINVKRKGDELNQKLIQYSEGILCDGQSELHLLKGEKGAALPEQLLSRLMQQIADDEKSEKEVAEDIAALTEQLYDIKRKIERITNRAANEKKKRDLISQLDKLKARDPEIKALREKKERADTAFNKLAPLLRDYEQIKNTVFSLEKKGELLNKDIINTKNQKEILAIELDAVLERCRQIQTELVSARERESRLNSFIEADKAYLQWQTLMLEKEKKEASYQKAYISYSEKTKEYLTLEKRFLDEQAGLLAKTLQYGMPCPVCGSLSHPEPARCSEDNADLDSNRIKELRRQSEEARNILETKSLAAKEASAGAAMLWNSRIIDCAQTPEEFIMKKNELLSEWGTKSLDEALNKLRDLAESFDKMSSDAEKYQGEIVEIDSQLKALLAVQKENRLFLKESQLKEALSKSGWENALKDNGFDSGEEYKKAIINEQESDLITRQIKSYEDSCVRVRSALDTIEPLIQATGLLNLDELEAEQNRLVGLLGEKRAQEKYLHAALGNNRRIKENIQVITEEKKSTANEYAIVKNLSDTANGELSGCERLAFEQYVQAVYFDDMIRRANRRLGRMTGGRYELLRRLRSHDNRETFGLELDVYDFYTGKARDVRTLSGGESFQAALCMALGMADVITEQSGGIHLDNLFIDEGFGTLDEESLKEAIKLLNELTQGERIIGIISHVEALKENIENQIYVHRGIKGSRVELIDNWR